MAMIVNTANTEWPQNLIRSLETSDKADLLQRETDSLNLNCSSYSSCFLSFCSCSRSKRDRGSYSSSGASDGSESKKIVDRQHSQQEDVQIQ